MKCHHEKANHLFQNPWISSGDDISEWHFANDPSHPIGHSNGHHDLAQPMLEVWLIMFVSCWASHICLCYMLLERVLI